MDKHELAAILEEIGTLLTIKGENPFKIRAYHNAARAIENLEEDINKIVEKKALGEIPGIGERLSKKITTIVKTGRLPYYEKLKRSIPEGLLELLKVPGLGGKKIKILYEKLKIKTVKDLLEACQKGKIANLKGFGIKTQENILNGITKIKTYGQRFLWWDAQAIALPLLKKIAAFKDVKKVEMAGSFRRKLETVGDLDILAASRSPLKVINTFIKQPFIKKVISKGPTKASVLLNEGIQVDFRVVSEEEFSFGLIYFIGSKEHNIVIRQMAKKLGLSLSEYGFEPIDHKKPIFPKRYKPTEDEIYRILGLCYMPPEIRENMGEIEAALKKQLPTLVEEKDIRGDLHCHTTASDGHSTLKEMVLAAQKLGWEYIGISDHSKSSFQAGGMDEEQLLSQIETIYRLNKSKKFSTYIFSGLECDILKNGKLDFPDSVLKKLDYVIASVHSSFSLDEKAMTARLIRAIENPYTKIVGHVTGRLLLLRDPYKVDLTKVIDACIQNGKIMELNAHPRRLDMDWRYWHKAKEKGLKCIINTDSHFTSDLLHYKAGVNVARKGWLEKKDILNTLPLSKMQSYLKKMG